MILRGSKKNHTGEVVQGAKALRNPAESTALREITMNNPGERKALGRKVIQSLIIPYLLIRVGVLKIQTNLSFFFVKSGINFWAN